MIYKSIMRKKHNKSLLFILIIIAILFICFYIQKLSSSKPVQIVCKIKTEYKNRNSDQKTISYEYPSFSCSNPKMQSIIDELNSFYEKEKDYDLNSNESPFLMDVYEDNAEGSFSQTVFLSSIEAHEQFTSISIGRTQEYCSPYPNNKYESYVIDTKKHTFAKLEDIISITPDIVQNIVQQISEEHSEKDIAILTADIETTIENNNYNWTLRDNSIIIDFDYEYITNAFHGDGEYAAIITCTP